MSQCQQGWYEGAEDPSPFIKYLLRTVLAAYRDFEERLEIISGKLSAYDMVKTAALNKLGKFTKADIMELCPTVGRASVENALKKLVEEGTLQRHGSGRATFYTIQ